MKVGFTGTAKGATVKQLVAVSGLIRHLGVTQFDHGDCVGSDTQAHDLVRSIGSAEIHLHPPTNSKSRTRCNADVEHLPAPYLVRNRNIVDSTQVLIATPKGMKEELRSGTWATIRYARKLVRRIFIVYPNGEVETEN